MPTYLIGLGFDVLNRVLRVVLLIAPALAVGYWAGRRIEAAHGLGRSRQGVSGRDAAAAILASRGLIDVETRTADGAFADWYDRETRTLRLSPAVADGRSFFALAVAAREAARAVRHAEGDPRDRLREPIVLGLRLGRATGWALMLAGFTLCLWAPADLGASVVTLATAVALPPWIYLERGLGRLSKRLLTDAGLIVDDDLPALSKALAAVAWTPATTGPLGWPSRRMPLP